MPAPDGEVFTDWMILSVSARTVTLAVSYIYAESDALIHTPFPFLPFSCIRAPAIMELKAMTALVVREFAAEILIERSVW